jgi:hypothetical protein
VVVPVVVTVVLGSEHVTFAKLLDTEQLNETAPVKPRKGLTLIVVLPELPA